MDRVCKVGVMTKGNIPDTDGKTVTIVFIPRIF